MSANEAPVCVPKLLPDYLSVIAARAAFMINPMNAPMVVEPQSIAVMTSKWWGAQGVDLSVAFLDPIRPDVRDKIMGYANLWNQYCNIQFRWTASARDADVRVASAADGYWSYLGTDIKGAQYPAPTMNLQGYLVGLPDSEYMRVVPHEFGHTAGCPHGQARRSFLDQLIFEETRAWYRSFTGWSDDQINAQVLTAIEDSALMGTTDPSADLDSVMTYEFPAQCVKNHQRIVGGHGITKRDGDFMNSVYPKAAGLKPLTSDDIAKKLEGIF